MAFSISPKAAEAIRRRLDTSTVDRPVAMMIDCSDSLPTSREMTEALLRKASKAELQDIARREWPDIDKLRFRLEVAIYSKSQHPFWALAKVNGFELVLPFWVRLALRRWTLDHADGRFLLRSGNRVHYTLHGRANENAA